MMRESKSEKNQYLKKYQMNHTPTYGKQTLTKWKLAIETVNSIKGTLHDIHIFVIFFFNSISFGVRVHTKNALFCVSAFLTVLELIRHIIGLQ